MCVTFCLYKFLAASVRLAYHDSFLARLGLEETNRGEMDLDGGYLIPGELGTVPLNLLFYRRHRHHRNGNGSPRLPPTPASLP